jgi:hypothetical protein
LATGAISQSRSHEQQTYVAQSDYAASYERWVRAVGADRLVVIFSEDYYERPAAVLRVVTDRLGIAPLSDDLGSTHRNAAPRPGAIDPGLDEDLTTRFRPGVERLGELLGTAPPWPRFARR